MIPRTRAAPGIAVVAGGLALAQAYPSTDWDILAWIALVPLLVVAVERPPGAAFGWSWVGAFVFFIALLRWLDFTFRTYSAIPWPLTWGPTALLAGYCAAWVGAVGASLSWIARRLGLPWAVAAIPFLWVAAEWGRGHLLGGFPWGLLGYSQYQRLPVIQVAELGGVHLVSFVVAAVNAALTGCVTLPRRQALAGLAASLIVAGATIGFGLWRLSEAPAETEVRVGIMQPAIEQPLKWDERHMARTLATYFGLSRRFRPGEVELLVWPETASPTVLRRDTVLRGALQDLSRELRAPVLVGSVDVEEGAPRTLRNTVFFLTERGIEGRYDKMHLVPFGEYVPLPEVIGFVRGWAEFISEMEPGTRPVIFAGPPAPFGVVICYEGIFPDLYRAFARGGARLMVNMTNDAWFGRTSGPLQHLAMYPLRAVEHRTALVRAANTGVSAFIAPTGRIVRRLGLFRADVITERLPLRSRTTLYTRLGDWPAWLSLAVSAAGLGAAASRRG